MTNANEVLKDKILNSSGYKRYCAHMANMCNSIRSFIKYLDNGKMILCHTVCGIDGVTDAKISFKAISKDDINFIKLVLRKAGRSNFIRTILRDVLSLYGIKSGVSEDVTVSIPENAFYDAVDSGIYKDRMGRPIQLSAIVKSALLNDDILDAVNCTYNNGARCHEYVMKFDNYSMHFIVEFAKIVNDMVCGKYGYDICNDDGFDITKYANAEDLKHYIWDKISSTGEYISFRRTFNMHISDIEFVDGNFMNFILDLIIGVLCVINSCKKDKFMMPVYIKHNEKLLNYLYGLPCCKIMIDTTVSF